MNTINLVGPSVTPKLMDPKKLMGVSNLLKYYDIQISLCEQMHAPDRANNIMSEAMPIILKYQGKQQFQDLVICETLCIYNLLIGRYDDALRSVEFCERYNSRTARFLNNVQKVRIYSYLRDMNSAYQFYNAAAGIAEKKNEQDILAYLNSYYLQSTEFGQN